MKSRTTNWLALGCVASACALPGIAAGQVTPESTLEWSLEGGVEYTDNVSRAATNEQSETVGVGAFSLLVSADRPRLDTNIGARLEYREYLDDTYESEVVGGVDGLVSYAFIPERFFWVVTDNFGQISGDRREVDTPDNRQNVNYFTTGPDIIIPFGTRTSMQLSGRWSDSYYEDSDEDNESLTGSLALIRQLSDRLSVSLNGSTTEIEYDEELLFGDYRLDQAFLRLASESERTTFIVDGGYTVIDQDGETSDGVLARLEISRAVASRSRIGLNAGTEFATAGSAFRRDQDLTGIVTGADDGLAASDPYQLDYAYLTWNTDWERSALAVVLTARSETHEVVTESDRDLYGGSITVSRVMSRRLDARLTGSYTEEEFTNQNFAFDEWGVGVGLTWRLSERFSVDMRLDHFEGSSDDATRDFDENRAFLGLVYSRIGS